tara:strand:+ start:392 stop:664 length:273 start_codon:yes stop_codon:yes gene_type:complete
MSFLLGLETISHLARKVGFTLGDLIQGYANDKKTKKELYVFLMSPMKEEFVIFVFNGQYKNRYHILNLLVDGEFDEQINRFRNNLNNSAA